jgi:hypothetical protein
MEHGVYPEALDDGEVQVLHLMGAEEGRKDGRAAIAWPGVAGCAGLQRTDEEVHCYPVVLYPGGETGAATVPDHDPEGFGVTGDANPSG